MKKYLVLFFSLAIGFVNAQSYYSNSIRGDSCFNKKNYSLAAHYYEKAICSAKYPNGRFYHNLAQWYGFNKNTDSAFLRLSEAVKYNYYSVYFAKEEAFKSFHKEERWMRLFNEIEFKCDSSKQIWTKELADSIKYLYGTYQEFETELEKIEIKFGKESEEYKEINIKCDSVILKHTDLLLDIVQKKGFSSQLCISHIINSSCIWNYVHHSRLYMMEALFLHIEQAAKEGKESASSVALLHDRILLNKGKKQIYGSQVDIKKQEFEPIWNEKNVNIRRDSMGLEPLEDYARNRGFYYILPK